MKIKLDMAGALPTHPDFEMLRAGLAAAQAATPTALAAHVARPAVEPLDVPYGLSAVGDAHDAAVTMRGSFHAPTARQLERLER